VFKDVEQVPGFHFFFFLFTIYYIYYLVLFSAQVSDITALWRDDLVSFFLGCSFGFERALQESGIEVRNITEGKNVSKYTADIQVPPAPVPFNVEKVKQKTKQNGQCTPVGPFSCPMVVSMRPIPQDKVEAAIEVTGNPMERKILIFI
jgi:uncharacterized protein YcsI (UPF0317 family)